MHIDYVCNIYNWYNYNHLLWMLSIYSNCNELIDAEFVINIILSGMYSSGGIGYLSNNVRLI